MFGIDVASYQSGIKVGAIPRVEFVIAKATGGTRYVNPDCNRVMDDAKKHGLARGLYHFAGDGFPYADAHVEADFFVDSIQGHLDGETLLVLDWEDVPSDPVTKRGVAYALKWLERVRERTGIKPLVYMNSATLHAYDWSSVVARDYGLWLANFNGASTITVPPAVSTGKWPFAAIRQYSETGRLVGYAGNLDLNYTDMTREQWKLYAGGKVAGESSVTSFEAVVLGVLDGFYGNGAQRVREVAKTGHDPAKVQAEVNKRLQARVTLHTVKSGDSLSTIAAQYGMSWEKLYRDNKATIGNNPHFVRPGIILKVQR